MKKAIYYYKLAAEQADLHALRWLGWLGNIHLVGDEVLVDYDKALYY